MVPHPHITLLGMEYFAWPEEEFWARDDQGLIALASAEGEEIGLFSASNVVTGMVIRVPHAYPVYRQGYKVHARDVRASLDKIENLQPIGRAGLFKYDSMDRAMMTGIYAARNCLGEQNPVWEISS
jgi:protoporphyrinogen oxidase